jgi:hypothetical protein
MGIAAVPLFKKRGARLSALNVLIEALNPRALLSAAVFSGRVDGEQSLM